MNQSPAYNAYPPQSGPSVSHPQPGPKPPHIAYAVPVHDAGAPRIVARPRYQDVWATIAFVLVLLAFVGAAVVAVPYTLKDLNNSTTTNNNNNVNSNANNNNTVNLSISGRDLGGFVGAAVGVSTAFSVVYFFLMMVAAAALIHITYWISILLLLGLCALYVMAKVYIAAIIWGVFAILFAVNYFLIRNRIPFATIMLKTVTRVIGRFSGTIFVGFAGLIVSIVYNVIWLATVVGMISYLREKNLSNNALYAIFVLLLFVLYWTSEVVRNTVHVTVSGTFATFYFTAVQLPGSGQIDVPEKAVTAKSAGRALTTSFGSICYGSLLIAIVATLKAIAAQAENDAASDGNICLCILAGCIRCFLACIQDILEYFNKYAFTQVAIYGKNYCQAGKDTWNLIQSRGLMAVINDNLIGNVLGVGSLLCGLLCAFVGFLFVKASTSIPSDLAHYLLVCIASAIVGMWIFLILTEVVTSGVATTYVCLAEDPATLARQQPDLYEKFSRTWPDIAYGLQSSVY
ncbi:putative choline transporter, neither null mutation nor overexpression affects choline transport [Irineochytrium annulatum]|nr:putative choline transporter, neither null mutation nor overexpression affects choline transport [Irineochytrium annulatum]